MRILVVDDEEDVCVLLKRFLVRIGKEVISAHNLHDALHHLESWHPDIMILDNNLPDGSGLNALPNLCATFPQTRIILISAMELQDSAMRNGAMAFLEKPVDLYQLEALINLKTNGNGSRAA